MKRVPANRYLCFFLLAGLGCSWDLYSKCAVFNALGFPGGRGPTSESFGGWLTFRLYTSFNHGALWGLGQGYSFLFASLSVIAVLAVLYWLFIQGAAISRWLTVSLAFVVAGALGNLYDRLGMHGYINRITGEPIFAVRDFLFFTFGTFHWPVFNFADVFLVTGAIMLVLQSFAVEEIAVTTSATTTTENKTPDEPPVDSANETLASAAS